MAFESNRSVRKYITFIEMTCVREGELSVRQQISFHILNEPNINCSIVD